MKKIAQILCILLCLAMVLSVAAAAFAAEETSATISFADKALLTEYSTEKQVWKQNGIVVTNDKAESTSDVKDYANPARFYKNSTLTIAYAGMKNIVVACNTESYANALVSAVTGATATAAGKNVTIALASAMDSFTVALTGGQVRVDSITVYTGDVETPVEPETPAEPEAPADPEANTQLTIAEAIALGASKAHNTYTTGKYYVVGEITEVYNETYGNMKLTDDAGNILTIYGTYSADGSTRYDAMDVQPVAGDTVKIYGIVGQFNGTAQIKNGWIVEHTPAACDHVFEDGFCTECGEEDPDYVPTVELVDLIIGRNNINGEDITYTYTATADGTLNLTLEMAATAADQFKGISIAYAINGGEAIDMDTTANKVTAIAMVSGDIVIVTVATGARRTLIASWTDATTEPAIKDLVIGSNTVNSENNSFTYTAPADGVLTLNCNKATAGGAAGGAATPGAATPGAATPGGAAGGAAAAAKNFSYIINDGTAVKITNGVATQIQLKKGDVVVITADEGVTGSITASWAELPAAPVEKDLVAFNQYNTSTNQVSLGETIISYTATKVGTLKFQVPKVMGNDNAVITVSYTINGGEPVTVSTIWNEYTFVDVKPGDQIKIYVTADCNRNVNVYWIACEHATTKIEGTVDATCEEKGFSGNTVCADCGELVAEGTEIAALGHNYEGNTCTVCGNPKTFDVFGIMVAVMAASGTALVCLKKKED